jgi:DNA polymerase (family X)
MAAFDKPTAVAALRELSLYLQLTGQGGFKTRAYDIAADRLSGLNDDLAALIEQNTLVDVPGIGASIATKLAELRSTGKIDALEQLKAQFPSTILQLLKVPDLGPKKVRALFDALNIGDIAALEKACLAHEVRALKGFGEKTEEKLLAGIAIARKLESAGERKRLDEAQPFADALLAFLNECPAVIRSSVGGSVRRQKETVADVDVLVSTADAETVFAHLLTFPQIDTVIARGPSKTSVRLKESALQIDVRALPDEDFATALHHFTGSKAHHIRLRSLALSQGYTVSEWGVFRSETARDAAKGSEKLAKHLSSTEKMRIADEGELYQLLGMQYVPPELREDAGEIEAALKHGLPRLVQLSDIIGNVHSHTVWSDGSNSLLEMALAAKALGLQYFTVTEHSQTSGYANGLKLDRLKKQWDEIDSVNSQVSGITLLKGIESDILEDGSLDYPDAVLSQLDVVIGSIHQRHSQDEAAMTARILNAFDNPFLHIWGHPTGRLLLRREPSAMRMNEIFEKAAAKGIVIEINGCPERLDLAPELVREARRHGLQFSVSTDAHSVAQLPLHLQAAVSAARRGWVQASEVVNTLPLAQFLQRLQQRSVRHQ